MARAYSAAYKSTLSSVNAAEAPLILCEITHAGLMTPVRIVNDTDDLTSNGSVYVAAPFRCTLPDDQDGQFAVARIAIDNVGRELMFWIETSNGGQGATVRFIQLMRSRPNTIEWEATMQLSNVRATMSEITGELSFDNVLMRPAVHYRYDPETAPGLF